MGAEAPRLRAMRFGDYDRVRSLLLANALHCPSHEDWRHRWIDNPLWQQTDDSPIGWVLETTSGEIVGSMESVPMGYRFRGADLVAAVSAAWCAQSEYRGYALQLIDEYFSQAADLFVSTTVGPAAVSTLDHFYGPIPLGRWDTTSYFITSHLAFARRALHKFQLPAAGPLAYPLSWMLALKDAVLHRPPPDASPDVTIEIANDFDDRFDVFWSQLVRENPDKLLAVRNRRTLSWHYKTALRDGRLLILTASKAGMLCGYCVFRQESAASERSMRTIDYQSIARERDLLPGFLRRTLQRCADEDFYILQNVGIGVPKMRAFDTYAPYRGKLPNSIFYYSAKPALAEHLKDPNAWDPSLYDGDAAL